MAYSGWGKRKGCGCSTIVFLILVISFVIAIILSAFYILLIGLSVYALYLIIKLIINQIKSKKQQKVKRRRISMVKCQSCNSLMPNYFTYCSNCGKKLFISCPNCRYKNRSANLYCINCGYKLNAFYMTEYQIERYAKMCNAYLEHQDEMEKYNDIDTL
ncbi:double zinc ribbon domain-containing protein [Mediterraneibacter glycyrrhizinilyticus]|uniref:double zinc ribbon domain-containing protein n=1 Tax=Mediterraneibacter glycyrrhizinilyticus TaxID=342942 RepID=UPI003B52F424